MLAPAPCNVPPSHTNTDPAGISARTISSGSAVRPADQRWLPGTSWVPPLSAQKSDIAHIVVSTRLGRGAGKNGKGSSSHDPTGEAGVESSRIVGPCGGRVHV